MASTNTTSIAYSLETVPGTTDASPTFLTLPTTSSSLTSNLTTAVSEVIRSDRQTDDLVVTDSEISGDIGFELSYAPWKPLLIALLQGDGTGTTIAAETAATAVNATSSFDLAGIETGRSVGDAIYASAASDDGSNDDIAGVYIITALGTDLITVTPTPRDSTADVAIREAVVHSNGAEVPNSYTFRTTAQNDAGTTYYYYHRGCQISSMNMNFSTGSILNGTTSVIGRSEEATPTAIVGETITPTPA